MPEQGEVALCLPIFYFDRSVFGRLPFSVSAKLHIHRSSLSLFVINNHLVQITNQWSLVCKVTCKLCTVDLNKGSMDLILDDFWSFTLIAQFFIVASVFYCLVTAFAPSYLSFEIFFCNTVILVKQLLLQK